MPWFGEEHRLSVFISSYRSDKANRICQEWQQGTKRTDGLPDLRKVLDTLRLNAATIPFKQLMDRASRIMHLTIPYCPCNGSEVVSFFLRDSIHATTPGRGTNQAMQDGTCLARLIKYFTQLPFTRNVHQRR
jgi:hypothetical protein